MLSSATYQFDIPANGSFRLLATGQFFRIISALGTVNVNTANANLKGLNTGDGQEKTPFDFILFTDTTGATNTVKVVVADQAFLNSPQNNTAITANKTTISASFTNTQKTVTNASAQLLAGNTARQYLLIQNNDPTGIIYVSFGATAATANTGIRILPGGFWEWDSTVSNQAVQCIGSIATQSNIVTVEG